MLLAPMPEVVSGRASLDALDRFLARHHARRVLVVTGPNVRKIADFQAIIDAITSQGRQVVLYDNTRADPSIELAGEACAFAKKALVHAVVGIGGGSPLDTAKVVAASLTNSVSVEAMLGADNIPLPAAPLACFPTTAGTGSEVTNISILTDEAAGLKKAIVSDRIMPLFAGLLPELTLGLPPGTTAATGMDALCHASEAILSRKRNPYSEAMGLAALPLIGTWLPRVIADPANLEARERMMEASLLAGLAFNNSSVTAIHAFAYPLGGRYHIAHGLANSLMFAPIMKHNYSSEPALFRKLGLAFTNEASSDFIGAVEAMRAQLPIAHNLREASIPLEALDHMADDVMSVTRLLSVNPQTITRADAGRIYQEAYQGA